MEKKLYYLPKFNAFGIADSELPPLGQIPTLKFNECYEKLGLTVPAGAPKVGFLLGREDGYYTIDYNYLYAIVKSGLEPVGLDYLNCTEQLAGCSALILPGGSFQSPDWYYVNAPQDADQSVYPNERSKAYAYALYTALNMGIPVLGICAGAQVIAAEMGGHLYPSRSYRKTYINHKSKRHLAHLVNIMPDSPLHSLLEVTALMTNSRHKELLADSPSLEIYAVARDGVPEAWGSTKDKVLGVQWHPEDYVVEGNTLHQKVYDWLAENAREYQINNIAC
jgi:gamma-glutamyl-gamma-aminobutyrate hydrolase PuuD